MVFTQIELTDMHCCYGRANGNARGLVASVKNNILIAKFPTKIRFLVLIGY